MKDTIKVGDHILEPVADKDVPPGLWYAIEKHHVNEAMGFLIDHPGNYTALKDTFDFSAVDKDLFLEAAETEYGKKIMEKLKKEIWG